MACLPGYIMQECVKNMHFELHYATTKQINRTEILLNVFTSRFANRSLVFIASLV